MDFALQLERQREHLADTHNVHVVDEVAERASYEGIHVEDGALQWPTVLKSCSNEV